MVIISPPPAPPHTLLEGSDPTPTPTWDVLGDLGAHTGLNESSPFWVCAEGTDVMARLEI